MLSYQEFRKVYDEFKEIDDLLGRFCRWIYKKEECQSCANNILDKLSKYGISLDDAMSFYLAVYGEELPDVYESELDDESSSE